MHGSAEPAGPANGGRSYAAYLASQGETVVELAGAAWMKYRGALIPAAAMPVYAAVAPAEARRALRRTGALFLRYSARRSETTTNWWHVVCRRYDFGSVSASTRSKIRRGLKRFAIRRVPAAWLADNGYDCHRRSYQRYAGASPLEPEQFRRFVRSLDGQPVFDVWGCWRGGELLGYVICLRETGGVFLHTVDITPAGLRDYAAYAMIHTLLDYYVNEKGVPVSNGTRSIAHATRMQDFLLKFGFEREYCELGVIYRPEVALIVRLLYPFRNVLKRGKRVPLIRQLSSVLFQEQLVREQQGRARNLRTSSGEAGVPLRGGVTAPAAAVSSRRPTARQFANAFRRGDPC